MILLRLQQFELHRRTVRVHLDERRHMLLASIFSITSTPEMLLKVDAKGMCLPLWRYIQTVCDVKSITRCAVI